MKWFKHYSNASSSLKLQSLISELGVEGYGQYWLLLELLCEKFDGESPEVTLFFDEISAKVRIKFTKKLETFLQKLSDFHLLSFQISGKFYKIEAPILLDLQSKDFKFATKQRLLNDSNATLRIKNKDIRLKNKKEINKEKIQNDVFDLELIYSHYPKKEGKKAGMDRLKKIIKNQETYDKVLSAVKNYSDKTKFDDIKFIKHFSSFISVWEDYLVLEKPVTYEQKMFENNPFRGN